MHPFFVVVYQCHAHPVCCGITLSCTHPLLWYVIVIHNVCWSVTLTVMHLSVLKYITVMHPFFVLVSQFHAHPVCCSITLSCTHPLLWYVIVIHHVCWSVTLTVMHLSVLKYITVMHPTAVVVCHCHTHHVCCSITLSCTHPLLWYILSLHTYLLRL
jgi:hypothetical protein